MLSWPENTTSADKVAANDDLLTEILIRLPVKSLLRFRSVSKHWHSLISSPHFAHLRNPDPCSVSGLILQPTSGSFLFWNDYTESLNLQLEFIPLTNEKFPTDDTHLGFPANFGNLSGIIILNSCCGLLLCLGYNEIEGKGGYHVLNPTTKQFKTLPEPNLDGLEGLCLAFDPSKSPHYKVVSVCSTHSVLSTQPYRSESYYHVEIYSSETGSWRASGETFTFDLALNTVFRGGVYWNGAINWLNDSQNSLYFNVQQEHLGTMPMLPVPEGKRWYDRRLMHYGASREHLYFVGIYGPTTQFDVYEMKRDYSEWFVQYKVNIISIASAFPEMTQTLRNWYSPYSIVSLVHGESDEESCLVLHLAGKLVRYNLVADTFETIYDLVSRGDRNGNDKGFYGLSTHHYIESYSAV